jgi:O-antigen/teichoic acid export membrane protein
VVFQFSILPLLGRLARRDDERFRTIFEQIIAMVFLFSIPIAIGGIILGGPIMTFVFGNSYAPGALSFQILMATLLFDFPIAIISNAIFAYNHQKSLIVSSAIGGVLNVGLDILFIPRFGIAGSAVATLIAQAASNWYLWSMMKRLNDFEVLPRLKKVAVAGIAMGAVTALLALTGTEVIVNIVVSAIAYFIALYLLHEPLLVETKRTLFGHGADVQPTASA